MTFGAGQVHGLSSGSVGYRYIYQEWYDYRMTDTEKHDPFAFGKAFAEFKKKTRPQKTIEGAFCPANVMRTEVEICGHPLDDDGNCANASAHLS